MNNQGEYQTIVQAALLHDIGKLLQRGSFGSLDVKGKHPEVSASFIEAYRHLFEPVADFELLKTLVQHHHESPQFPPSLRVDGIADPRTRSLASLVSLADNYSASERGQRAEQWQDFKFTPLASVLERVHIPKLREATTHETKGPTLRFRAGPLASTAEERFNSIFPDPFERYADGELNQQIKAFGEEFAAWAKGAPPSDFSTLFSHMLHFLFKYAWCLPSNTQEEVPDVSLFDHLKTTAAIAACLYLYHAEAGSLNEQAIRAPDQTRFCLVAGDISGIQSYIFGISNIGSGGVARRLRARSLFVQLVAESCAHRILKDFDLPMANVLMSAGGNFHLLLPQTSNTEALLNQANEDIDRWFLEKLNGEMALNLAHEKFRGEEFRASFGKVEGFGGVVRRAGDKLARVKQQRFGSVLQNGHQWQPARFT